MQDLIQQEAGSSRVSMAGPDGCRAPGEVGDGENTELPMGENSAPAAMGDIMLGDMNPAPPDRPICSTARCLR